MKALNIEGTLDVQKSKIKIRYFLRYLKKVCTLALALKFYQVEMKKQNSKMKKTAPPQKQQMNRLTTTWAMTQNTLLACLSALLLMSCTTPEPDTTDFVQCLENNLTEAFSTDAVQQQFDAYGQFILFYYLLSCITLKNVEYKIK